MRSKYDIRVLIGVVIITFILFCVFSYLYRRSSYTEAWLICEYPENYRNYTETLKFRYVEERLYGYYREEHFIATDTSDLEERYEYFSDIADDLYITDDFSYEVEKGEDEVIVNTYIGVFNEEEIFNNYMASMEMTNDSNLEEIESKLEEQDYTCHIQYK